MYCWWTEYIKIQYATFEVYKWFQSWRENTNRHRLTGPKSWSNEKNNNKTKRKQNVIKIQSLMAIKIHHHTKFEAIPHTHIPDNARKPHGPLARYVNFPVAHAPRMAGTSYPPLRISDPDMHHGTCVTHVPWCLPGSLTSGFLWNRWRGKRSRHSRHMHNP